MDGMHKNVAAWILKASQNGIRIGTPKIYQETFLAIWASQKHSQNGALLIYILCASMTPAGGSDFGPQIDFLRVGDVPLGTEFGQGFRIDTATFVSILSKQNAHFF